MHVWVWFKRTNKELTNSPPFSFTSSETQWSPASTRRNHLSYFVLFVCLFVFFCRIRAESSLCTDRLVPLLFSDATILAPRFTSVSVAKQLLTLRGCRSGCGSCGGRFHVAFVHGTVGFNGTRTQQTCSADGKFITPILGVLWGNLKKGEVTGAAWTCAVRSWNKVLGAAPNVLIIKLHCTFFYDRFLVEIKQLYHDLRYRIIHMS